MSESEPQNFHFEYPIRNNPLLAELKDVYGHDIDPTKSEFENAKDIIGYAHGLFTHDGDNTPSSADPLTILKEAQAGQSFRCVEYSTLATGLFWANGIPARTIGLKTRDVETREYGAGHVVIEFWSKELNKWVMSDVQVGAIPASENTPLSALELKQKLEQNEQVSYLPVANSKFDANSSFGEKPSYSDWVKEYLYFIDTPVSLTLGDEDKSKQLIAMLVPTEANNPKMFQAMFTMNAIYLNSPSDFYRSPEPPAL